MRAATLSAIVLASGLAAFPPADARAQNPPHGPQGAAQAGGMHGMEAAHHRMNQRMAQAMHGGGDIERNFAAMMVPHHEGAVEMARAALPSIRDPELRRMAEKTIEENEREARELRAWLDRRR